MSISDKDCQRFFRAGILTLKHGTALLQNLLDFKLQQMHLSLRELLYLHRHDLFHSWYKNGCCTCPTAKPSYFSGHLIKSQYEDLFELTKTPNRVCQHVKTSLHGICSCRYEVRKDVHTRSLDIPVSSTLLLNLDDFRYDDASIEAIWELRRLRNEIIDLGSEMCLIEEKFQLFWNRLVSSVGSIAALISADSHDQTTEQIRSLRDDPLHLYSAMTVVRTISHGNQRELSFLQDLQDVMGMQSNKRQGEVLAMLELGLELFSSTLSQSNLALKELQNCKFLLYGGNFTGLAKNLSSPWMKKLLKARLQVHEQTEIWREMLWSSDPLKSKVSQTLSFKSCGENVKLSNDRRCAAWNFIESDGVTFSNRPMDHLEHVTLGVTGSGEVAIGAIESDPVVQSRRLSSFSTCPDLKTAVIVKTYDSSYQVKISRDSDLLIVFCDDQRYVMEVDQKKKPWLVFNLRFGDLQIELESEAHFPMKFHETMGTNVQSVGGTKRLLRLKHVNLRSTCRLSRRLRNGEEVLLNVCQEKPVDVRTIPCYLSLGISADGLQNGSLHEDQPFISASRSWLFRKRYDQSLCSGKVRISVTRRGVLKLVCPQGMTETVQLSNTEQKMGVAVVFELFRTELDIVSYKIRG